MSENTPNTPENAVPAAPRKNAAGNLPSRC